LESGQCAGARENRYAPLHVLNSGSCLVTAKIRLFAAIVTLGNITFGIQLLSYLFPMAQIDSLS
jgi:hypothetical protein